jgi:HK97 family phage major capsid protein
MKRCLNGLRQDRAAALKEARAINDRAAMANRDITNEERKQFEALMKNYESLGDQIGREDVLDREQRHLDRPTSIQVDQNSDWEPEGRTSFTDAATGREFRCFNANEPIADVRNESALDFARVLIERCSGQRLLTPERRSLQVDSDVSGGYLVNSSSAFSVFELARAKSAVARAGAKTLPIVGTDSVNLAIVTADPEFSWARELETYALDDGPTFGTMKLEARKCITQIELSYEFFRTANGANVILDLLTKSLAAEIDRVCLSGDTAVTGGATPTGILNTTGILTAAATGSTLTLDQLLDVLGTLQAANVEPNSLILPPAVNSLLSRIKDGDGRYFDALPSDLGALQKIVSSKMPSTTLIMGDFQQLILVPFGAMEVSVVKDVASRRGSFLIEVHSFFDCAPVFVNSFHAMTSITS